MKAIVTSVKPGGSELYVHYEIWTEEGDKNHDYFISPDQEKPEVQVQSPVEISALKLRPGASWLELEKILKDRLSKVAGTVNFIVESNNEFVGKEVKL